MKAIKKNIISNSVYFEYFTIKRNLKGFFLNKILNSDCVSYRTGNIFTCLSRTPIFKSV